MKLQCVLGEIKIVVECCLKVLKLILAISPGKVTQHDRTARRSLLPGLSKGRRDFYHAIRCLDFSHGHLSQKRWQRGLGRELNGDLFLLDVVTTGAIAAKQKIVSLVHLKTQRPEINKAELINKAVGFKL